MGGNCFHFCTTRELVRCAAATVAAITASIPLAEVAQDKTAVAVLSKSTRIIKHHSKFFVFELAARFEFLKVDATKTGIIGLQDTQTSAFAGMYFVDVAISLQ